MLLTEDEKELYSRVMEDLFDDISAEDIAGKMDEAIFQLIQGGSDSGYSSWFAECIFALEKVRNMFLSLTDGKMYRKEFDKLKNDF